MDTCLENHSFIHLSSITICTQGGICNQFFKFYKFFWDMCTICPKIFSKLDFFATMSEMGLTYSVKCLVLKILENWKKKHSFLE